MAESFEVAQDDLPAFYRFPEAHWAKLPSTNIIEWVIKQISRRDDVVGISPKDNSVIRLIWASRKEVGQFRK